MQVSDDDYVYGSDDSDDQTDNQSEAGEDEKQTEKTDTTGINKAKSSAAKRTRLTDFQITMLEGFFECERHPTDYHVLRLSELLNLSCRRIRIWFSNANQKTKTIKSMIEQSDVKSNKGNTMKANDLSESREVAEIETSENVIRGSKMELNKETDQVKNEEIKKIIGEVLGEGNEEKQFDSYVRKMLSEIDENESEKIKVKSQKKEDVNEKAIEIDNTLGNKLDDLSGNKEHEENSSSEIESKGNVSEADRENDEVNNEQIKEKRTNKPKQQAPTLELNEFQTKVLRNVFECSTTKPKPDELKHLSETLNLSRATIKTWFKMARQGQEMLTEFKSKVLQTVFECYSTKPSQTQLEDLAARLNMRTTTIKAWFKMARKERNIPENTISENSEKKRDKLRDKKGIFVKVNPGDVKKRETDPETGDVKHHDTSEKDKEIEQTYNTSENKPNDFAENKGLEENERTGIENEGNEKESDRENDEVTDKQIKKNERKEAEKKGDEGEMFESKENVETDNSATGCKGDSKKHERDRGKDEVEDEQIKKIESKRAEKELDDGEVVETESSETGSEGSAGDEDREKGEIEDKRMKRNETKGAKKHSDDEEDDTEMLEGKELLEEDSSESESEGSESGEDGEKDELDRVKGEIEDERIRTIIEYILSQKEKDDEGNSSEKDLHSDVDSEGKHIQKLGKRKSSETQSKHGPVKRLRSESESVQSEYNIDRSVEQSEDSGKTGASVSTAESLLKDRDNASTSTHTEKVHSWIILEGPDGVQQKVSIVMEREAPPMQGIVHSVPVSISESTAGPGVQEQRNTSAGMLNLPGNSFMYRIEYILY